MTYYTPNRNTFYSDSTVCADCGQALILDEDEGWTTSESATCRAEPNWSGTTLTGWTFTAHAPVIVEVK